MSFAFGHNPSAKNGCREQPKGLIPALQQHHAMAVGSTTIRYRAPTPDKTFDMPLSVGEIDTKAVDEMLSRQLADLSFADRNAINEEVHGVRNLAADESLMVSSSIAPSEISGCLSEQGHAATVNIVDKSLWLFLIEIERIDEKPAYDQAVYILQSRFVHDRAFHLRCLRSERFDVRKAARRFVKYLDLLLDYYGTEALMRPLRMSDLGKEEMEILRSGCFQLLPFRDRSGRRIIANVGEIGLSFSLYARMKFFIYFWWVAGDDDETQQRGIVSIFWPSFEAAPDRRESTVAARVFDAIPIRITALHNCIPDHPAYKLMQAVVILTMSLEARTRLKFHTATNMEIGYRLMGYGIPVDLIPVTATGNIKLKNHQQWMKTRKVVEEGDQKDTASIIECPFMNDVIFRFGKSYLSHPGNTTFRGLIEAYFDEHNNAVTTEAKVSVTWRIVEDVERRGGRFLEWDKRGFWKPLTDRNQIRSKVAVSLKEHKKRVLAKRNLQVNSSSTYQFERQDGKKRKRTEDGTESGTGFCAF